jgi:hypothetical protein
MEFVQERRNGKEEGKETNGEHNERRWKWVGYRRMQLMLVQTKKEK